MSRYGKWLCLLLALCLPYGSTQGSEGAVFDHDLALETSQGVIGSTIRNVSLVDSDGQRVDLDTFLGKPLIISLIYTSCHHICPTTTQHLKKVVRAANDALGNNSFSVVTIGFDVYRDNPAMMGNFAAVQGVAEDNWWFLSADEQTIKQLTGELGFLYYEAPHGFDHLIQATLLTKDREIYRQVYGISFDMPLLTEPLKELVFNEPTTSVFQALANQVLLFCTVYDPSQDKYRYDYSLFIGMFIGIGCVGLLGLQLVKEWRRTLVQRS